MNKMFIKVSSTCCHYDEHFSFKFTLLCSWSDTQQVYIVKVRVVNLLFKLLHGYIGSGMPI